MASFIALVAMQGTFKDVKGTVRNYSDGALIYPSMAAEGTESATRHCARLLTQRRVAKLDGNGDPIVVDGEVQYEDLSACVLTFEDPFSPHRFYGVDEVAAFLKGRKFTASGKLPNAVKLAWTKAKRAEASDARKAAKLAATAVAPEDAEAEATVEA